MFFLLETKGAFLCDKTGAVFSASAGGDAFYAVTGSEEKMSSR